MYKILIEFRMIKKVIANSLFSLTSFLSIHSILSYSVLPANALSLTNQETIEFGLSQSLAGSIYWLETAATSFGLPGSGANLNNGYTGNIDDNGFSWSLTGNNYGRRTSISYSSVLSSDSSDKLVEWNGTGNWGSFEYQATGSFETESQTDRSLSGTYTDDIQLIDPSNPEEVFGVQLKYEGQVTENSPRPRPLLNGPLVYTGILVFFFFTQTGNTPEPPPPPNNNIESQNDQGSTNTTGLGGNSTRTDCTSGQCGATDLPEPSSILATVILFGSGLVLNRQR